MSTEQGGTLAILTRGINEDGSMNEATGLRAEIGYNYLQQHESEVTRIVPIGGWALGTDRPPNGATEAGGVGDYLRGRGISGAIIDEENLSRTSIQGAIELARKANEGNWIIDENHPLFVVCSWIQFARFRPIARQAMGLSQNAVVNVQVPEKFSFSGLLEVSMVPYQTLLQMWAPPKNLSRTAKTDKIIEATVGRLVRGRKGFLGR
ncbi:MAG TPA: hypothetical protein VLG47_02315 [Candidatus Saccharimonadales bacterium]|nr:hypothetical protein [Candidatus Saccharimonadales bacterium]